MKEIIFLVHNISTDNKTNQFIISLMDELYKKDIKVTIFSKKFYKNFAAYIAKKQLKGKSYKKYAKQILNYIQNQYAIIAIDYPMNIVASLTKKMMIKKKYNNSPIIISYNINFQDQLYKNEVFKITNNLNRKLDYQSANYIDIFLASKEKVKNKLLYIHDNIKNNIEIIYPFYSLYTDIKKNNYKKENNFVIFFDDVKSIYRCINAFALYLKEAKEKYSLKIIGECKELHNIIKKLNIDSYVEIINKSDKDKVVEVLEKSKVIIIYDKNDCFCIELILAEYYDMIVVADNKSLVYEIVSKKENNNIVFFNSENSISLSEKLKVISEEVYTKLQSSNITLEVKTSDKILEIIENYYNN